MEQLDHPTTPTTHVQNAGVGVGILADGRFVYLSTFAPAWMGGGVTSSKEILTVEIECDVLPP
jgi:hypothetical protein